MSKSTADTTNAAPAAERPGAGSRTRSSRSRRSDGIIITRWNLGLSLTIALTVVTGAFSLLWERTNALQATQIELVGRVSRLEVQVAELREDVDALREDVGALREEMRALREEMRAEIRAVAELIRARDPAPDGPEGVE